jgi:hypothetical protein
VKLPPDTANPPVALATVMFAVPSNDTPPIVLAVCNAVAVPALPEIVVWSPVFVPEEVPENVPFCVARVPNTVVSNANVPAAVIFTNDGDTYDRPAREVRFVFDAWYAEDAVYAAVPSVPPVPTFNVDPSVPEKVKVFVDDKVFPPVTESPVTVPAFPEILPVALPILGVLQVVSQEMLEQ